MRPLLRPSRFFSAIAAIALAACGTPPAAPSIASSAMAPSAVHHPHDSWRLIVYLVNGTDKYVHFTRYWSYKHISGWYIEGTNCVAPREEVDATIDYSTLLYRELAQARIRAEVKDNTKDCTGNTVPNGDVTGPTCDVAFGSNHTDKLYAKTGVVPEGDSYRVVPWIQVDRLDPCD